MAERTYDPDDTFLTDLLTRYWQLDSNEIACSEHDLEEKRYTVSQIVEHYLRKVAPEILGRKNDNFHDDNLETSGSVPSVSSMVGRTLVRSLITGELDPDYILCEVFSDEAPLNMHIIGRWLLSSGRLPYHLLCAFLCPLSTAKSPKWVQKGNSRIPTLDDAIIMNEAYLRSRIPEENKNGVYLVTLDQILGNVKPITTTVGELDRLNLREGTTIPSRGFEFLDHRRHSVIQLHTEDSEVIATFDRITGNIMNGLDWNNIFVAGGIVLTSLTHIDPSKDDLRSVQDSDINVYLYGLDVEAANRKVVEIYNVWRQNLPESHRADSQLVVKSTESITFYSDYPIRRVQIVLKLFSSPTDILLSFDLDPCAMGIDGSRVYMLPRCARALETGYSVFTTDWHNASSLRSTTHQRFLKYANRGYGVRILPSYIVSLELDYDCEDLEVGWDQRIKDLQPSQRMVTPATMDLMDPLNSPVQLQNARSRTAYRLQNFLHTSESPTEELEPGLKTLKRIAYLGWDFPNRFCFVNTPLAFPSPENLSEEPLWEPDYEKRKDIVRLGLRGHPGLGEMNMPRFDKPPAQLNLVSRLVESDLDNEPDERMGHQSLEDFVRLAEAWRLADEFIDEARMTGFINSTGRHHTDPRYAWDESFNLQELETEISDGHTDLFQAVKRTICKNLDIEYRNEGWRGYLTRRIRDQVCGHDVKSVMAKQITIPVMLPSPLEDFLRSLQTHHPDLPSHYLTNPFLIPIHDREAWQANQINPNLPSLDERYSEAGNLRLWVITNKSMWSGQHYIIDEVTEILHSLAYRARESLPVDDADSVWNIASHIRRRAMHPDVSTAQFHERVNATEKKLRQTSSGLPMREIILFRSWVFAVPILDRWRTKYIHEYDDLTDLEFGEDDILYPIPEELYWIDNGAGSWKVEATGKGVWGDSREHSRAPSEMSWTEEP